MIGEKRPSPTWTISPIRRLSILDLRPLCNNTIACAGKQVDSSFEFALRDGDGEGDFTAKEGSDSTSDSVMFIPGFGSKDSKISAADGSGLRFPWPSAVGIGSCPELTGSVLGEGKTETTTVVALTDGDIASMPCSIGDGAIADGAWNDGIGKTNGDSNRLKADVVSGCGVFDSWSWTGPVASGCGPTETSLPIELPPEAAVVLD